ncbi:hypothetical protein [Acinetobacter indicus]|uniref:hypothetical protein n=1 Tax=Acinetobacter indicus TaxID=756892 RepID=UPI00209A9047|nr:hypothetical protein [Acinetobacter indicus]MCO8088207.1 hypothetical protein [Acinetobacter indicus]
MDIQKELDEFTSQKHIREKLRPDMRFDKRYNHFFSVTNSNCDWINGAWYGWQEAKAKAVPEGFVLVPKGLIKTLHEQLLDYEPDSFVVNRDICELWRHVEAQEPANESN